MPCAYDACMSSGGPLEPGEGEDDGSENPFGAFGFLGLPFLNDITKMLGQQGPDQVWDQARQLARAIATGGQSEPNVDPSVRVRYEELARVAEMHVQTATGFDLTRSLSGSVRCVTKTEFTSATVDDFRPVLDAFGASFGGAVELPDDDPMAQMLGPILSLLAPMTKAMTAGGLIGHLGAAAFGSEELPIPRPRSEVLVVPDTIDAFGREWSLEPDELRLWVMIERITFHAVLAVPHLRDELIDLLTRHAAAFRNDPAALEQQLGSFDPAAMSDPAALQNILGDPRMLLGAMRTPEQDEIRARVSAMIAVIIGYVDDILDQAGTRLIGANYGMLSEALRRRRVEASDADRFVVELLGLDVDRATVDTGRKFVDGVIERSDRDTLARLFEAPGRLPTPNELGAPGLWLARIDLPDDL